MGGLLFYLHYTWSCLFAKHYRTAGDFFSACHLWSEANPDIQDMKSLWSPDVFFYIPLMIFHYCPLEYQWIISPCFFYILIYPLPLSSHRISVYPIEKASKTPCAEVEGGPLAPLQDRRGIWAGFQHIKWGISNHKIHIKLWYEIRSWLMLHGFWSFVKSISYWVESTTSDKSGSDHILLGWLWRDLQKKTETHIFRDQPYTPNSVPWILQSYFAMGCVYINYTLNTLWCILYNLY